MLEDGRKPLWQFGIDAMSGLTETSDKALLDYLRRHGDARISDLVAETGVTATAVRQRIQRLMADGLIERTAETMGRGRPNHRYSLTEKGERRPAIIFRIWRRFCGMRLSRWQIRKFAAGC